MSIDYSSLFQILIKLLYQVFLDHECWNLIILRNLANFAYLILGFFFLIMWPVPISYYFSFKFQSLFTDYCTIIVIIRLIIAVLGPFHQHSCDELATNIYDFLNEVEQDIKIIQT